MLKNESLLGLVMIPIQFDLECSFRASPSSLDNLCLFFFEKEQVDKTFIKAIKYVIHQLVDYILSI